MVIYRAIFTCLYALAMFGSALFGHEQERITYDSVLNIADIIIEYRTAQDAAQGSLQISPLYDNKRLAVTTRWDDTNRNHLFMAKAMHQGGWRGTFYLVSPDRKYCDSIVKSLLQLDCGIGSHSMTHPVLPILNPNDMFRECLESRVRLESDTDKPVLCFATPGGSMTLWVAKETATGHLLGEALQRSGYIGGPEFTLYPEKVYGLPSSEWQGGCIIAPGDRSTTIEDFSKKIEGAVSKIRSLNSYLPVVVGVHSLQSDEEMRIYEECYKKYGNNSDWWYCEMNEYLAYRYQANHANIKKMKIEGTFSSYELHYTPFLILSAFPTLTLTSSCPMKSVVINGQPCQLSNDCCSFNWGKPEAALQKIDVAAPDGSLQKYPGLNARLSIDVVKNQAVLQCKNNSGHDLDHVTVQLRIPPRWKHFPATKSVSCLPVNGTKCMTWELGEYENNLENNEGSLYFAAQIDFMSQATPCRIYATANKPQEYLPSSTPRDMAMLLGPLVESEQTLDFLNGMSSPSVPLHNTGFQINEQWLPPHIDTRIAPIIVALYSDASGWKAMKEEICKKNRSVLLCIALIVDAPDTGIYWLFSRKDMKYIFLNGVKIQPSYEIELSLHKGENRLIVAFPANAPIWQCLGVAKKEDNVRSSFLKVNKIE